MRYFIGCSSKDEVDQKYHHLAKEVGKILQNEKIVVGGSYSGLMGCVAKENACEVTQVILDVYVSKDEVLDHGIICHSSFERLANIWNLSDVFLFLPGGTGTLAEILSFLEENRTQNTKKILILNEDGFYDEVIQFFRKCQEEKFSPKEIFDHLIIFSHVEELKEFVRSVEK